MEVPSSFHSSICSSSSSFFPLYHPFFSSFCPSKLTNHPFFARRLPPSPTTSCTPYSLLTWSKPRFLILLLTIIPNQPTITAPDFPTVYRASLSVVTLFVISSSHRGSKVINLMRMILLIRIVRTCCITIWKKKLI